MKQIAEFVPIALFFIVYQLDGQSISLAGWKYQFDGIFSATAVLMAATVLQATQDQVKALAIARTLGSELGKMWGQQLVVDPRPGGAEAGRGLCALRLDVSLRDG